VKGKNGEVKAAKEAQQLPSQPAQVLGSGSGSGVEEHGDSFAVWVRGGRCRPARREAQTRVRRNQATSSAGGGRRWRERKSRRWCGRGRGRANASPAVEWEGFSFDVCCSLREPLQRFWNLSITDAHVAPATIRILLAHFYSTVAHG
jgi:hypothetical protein